LSDSEKEGKSEVYISNDIVVAEIHGGFGSTFIKSVKHKLLELAVLTKNKTKRFLIMFFAIPEEAIKEDILYSFLTFYREVEGMVQRNVKLITKSEMIRKILRKRQELSKIEIVPNLIKAMQLLNLQMLKQDHESIKLSFIKPGVKLFANVYDKNGATVKERHEPFTAEEIKELHNKGVENLYYVNEALSDKAIFESPLIDVSAIKIPGTLIK
jgi:hypothetical protein